MERKRRDPPVKNLHASDSIAKTTQSPWFHGMWTARKKSFGFVTGWSVNGVTNEKHFQAYLRNKREIDNCRFKRTSSSCRPPPIRGREV